MELTLECIWLLVVMLASVTAYPAAVDVYTKGSEKDLMTSTLVHGNDEAINLLFSSELITMQDCYSIVAYY